MPGPGAPKKKEPEKRVRRLQVTAREDEWAPIAEALAHMADDDASAWARRHLAAAAKRENTARLRAQRKTR